MRINILGAAIVAGLTMSLGKALAGGGFDVHHIHSEQRIARTRGDRKTKTAAQLKREAIKRRNIEKRK